MWNRSQKRFDQLLDQLTSPDVVEHDFANIYQLCDLIKSNEISPVVAFNRIKKKLPPCNKDLVVNALALECLGIMAKNCGQKFYEQLGNQEFLQELRDFISSAPDVYRNKALELLQSWALGIEHNDHTMLINLLYLSLKSKGFSFPEVNVKDLKAMYQTCTPVEWADGRRCYRCRADFTATLRKHHCRKCGQVVCYSCSSKRMTLPEFGIDNEVRVCDTCYNLKITKSIEYDISTSDPFAQHFTSDLKPTTVVDHTNYSLFDDEDAQLNLALEISRQEAENANKRIRQTNMHFHVPSSTNQTPVFYPDLQTLHTDDIINYPSQKYHPSVDYSLPVQTENTLPLKGYYDHFSPSTTVVSQSTNSMLRFDQYNPSAPSPVDTISETDMSIQHGDLNLQQIRIDDNLQLEGSQTATKEAQISQYDSGVLSLVNKIHEKITLFNLRLKRNQSRLRSTANDQYARSLCVSLTELEPQLVDQLNELEERRIYFESLQDKLTEIVEIRKALDELRQEAYNKRLNEQGNLEELRRKMLELKRNKLRVEKVIRQPLLPPGMENFTPTSTIEDVYTANSTRFPSDALSSLNSVNANVLPVTEHDSIDNNRNASNNIIEDKQISFNTMNVIDIETTADLTVSDDAQLSVTNRDKDIKPMHDLPIEAIFDTPIEILSSLDFTSMKLKEETADEARSNHDQQRPSDILESLKEEQNTKGDLLLTSDSYEVIKD